MEGYNIMGHRQPLRAPNQLLFFYHLLFFYFCHCLCVTCCGLLACLINKKYIHHVLHLILHCCRLASESTLREFHEFESLPRPELGLPAPTHQMLPTTFRPNPITLFCFENNLG